MIKFVKHYVAVGLVLLVGLLFSFVLFQYMRDLDRAEAEDTFRDKATEYATQLDKLISAELNTLKSVVGLFNVSKGVTRSEFHNLAKIILHDTQCIQALEWVPWVGRLERASYEQAARADGYADFQITERSAQGEMIPAAERNNYYPVYYIEPYAGNEKAIGFDLGSSAERLAAMERARDSGQIVVSDRVELVQLAHTDAGNSAGVLIFSPVYHGDSNNETLEQRRQNLIGYTLGVVNLSRLFAAVNEQYKAKTQSLPADVYLFDLSSEEPGRLLFFQQQSKHAHEGETTSKQQQRSVEYPLSVADREWSLVITADQIDAAAFPALRSAYLPIASLLITFGVCAYLIATVRRRRRGELQASQRTQELNHATQEVQDRQALIHAIVDTAVDGIISINDRGIIETYNRAAVELFGYSSEEVVGNNVNMLMPEPYAAEHDTYLGNYKRSGKAKIIGIGREVTGKRKDGSLFPMELSVAEVRLGDRRIFAGIVRDMTQRKLSEDELLKAKHEAEKANRAKSEFLSRMSHELRTPLNAILGFAQLLELEDLSPSERESTEHILKAGRHLTDLVNEVLDIARIESGRQDLSPELVKVREVLIDSWGLIRPIAVERGVHLKNDIGDDCDVHVIADLQKLKQVFLNLMSNAVKYNFNGGMVTIGCAEIRPGIIRISISDTGPGIEEESWDRIFEPFDRLGADVTGEEGSGVGLALSKALTGAMGGMLGFDSEPGKGSTFWLELPLIEHAEGLDDDISASPESAESIVSPYAEPSLVLYIEDNITNFRVVEVALKYRPSIRLIAAMQGEMGIDLAQKHKPDLILLDMHLPDIDGGEVLSRLKSDPETQQIPVVIISADATHGQVGRLLSAGALSYLTKPYNIQELLHILDVTLDLEES